MTEYKTSLAIRQRTRAYYYANKEACLARNKAARERRRGPRKHELSQHQSELPEYGVWASMKKRCYNVKAISYPRYGARGIRVCDRWLKSFLTFYEDVGARPTPSHQLDRIDNDGPYSPENCRWATRHQQGSNTGLRRDNKTGYKGVSFNQGKYVAAVRSDGQDFHLGVFQDPAEAAWMRDQFAVALHGEFARLNFDYEPVEAQR